MLITPISVGYENKSNTRKYIEMCEVFGRHSLTTVLLNNNAACKYYITLMLHKLSYTSYHTIQMYDIACTERGWNICNCYHNMP
jgi:hypothetical protein